MNIKNILLPFIAVVVLCSCTSNKPTNKNTDLLPYLSYNWTEDSVLMEHKLVPNDSGSGWDFYLADIDFDGNREMLVNFSANHLGNNSLYIYKSENNSVVNTKDIIASSDVVRQEYSNIKELLPDIFNIDIIDVYQNTNKYRYFTTDCFSVNGDISAVIYQVNLDSNNTNCIELARVNVLSESSSDNLKLHQVYFMGDEIKSDELDSITKLNNLLADYMKDYTKIEIQYQKIPINFPRDIVSYNSDEKANILKKLYKAIDNLV